MKKILGILLTVAMLLTSMSVLAAGETTEEPAVIGNSTVVWSWDFETADGDVKASQSLPSNLTYPPTQSGVGTSKVVDSSTDPNVLSPFSGNQYLYLAGTSGSYYYITARQNRSVALEPKTLYRFSFRYAITAGTPTPYLAVSGGGSSFIAKRGYIGFAQASSSTAGTPATDTAEAVAGTAVWNYYEVYFLTADTLASTSYLGINFYSNSNYVEYYDDLKLEKINGNTAISFKSGPSGKSGTDSINSKNWGLVAQEAHAISGTDGKAVKFYPFSAAGGHLSATQSPIYINITHVPRAVKETVTVVVAWYKTVDGNEVLQGITMKPITYEAKTGTDANGNTYYYFDENMMNANATDTLYISGARNYHMKAFVLSSLSAVEPLAVAGTLPAAQ